jgi:hypothetical protein
MIAKHVNGSSERFPVQDYSRALQQAVSWLGERYLLAAPVTAHPRRERRPYFQTTSPWNKPHRLRRERFNPAQSPQ